MELFLTLAKSVRPGSVYLLEGSRPETFDRAVSYVKDIFDRC